ncbi:hypothetical protein FM996_10325 [Methylosinus sporium]|uniref:Uncharacterized protein n=1 Tax=Methylosinus sporium TaxID=428 RepID=A0A549SWA7_METSR|nr:hypothetical protein [Methylosinus sporium]TRL33922.1 hypothetical protein FM996_10325 [Methylosinus sporium]
MSDKRMSYRAFVSSMRVLFCIFFGIFAVLIFAFCVGFAKDLLDTAVEHLWGCASGKEEVASDESAIRHVKDDYLIQAFMKKHQGALNSEEYARGLNISYDRSKDHRGGWFIERRWVGFGREILDVGFLYGSSASEIEIGCTMTRCGPSPRCRSIAN